MILIAGTIRVPLENLTQIKPHMEKMLTASRAEDGCHTYSYAIDVVDPGLVRIFESWRDRAAIDAHVRSPHMAEWRAAGTALGVSDRRLSIYEVESERPL